MQVSIDVAAPEVGGVVLRASASAVMFPGFLAAYAPHHFKRSAVAGDDDAAEGSRCQEGRETDASTGGGGDGDGVGDEQDAALSTALMKLAVRCTFVKQHRTRLYKLMAMAMGFLFLIATWQESCMRRQRALCMDT